MNPTVLIMADGDMATTWRHIIAEVTMIIAARMEAARVLIDPRLLPARRHPSPRMVAAGGAPVAAVAAIQAPVEAAGDAESFADIPYLIDGCSSIIETGSCRLHAPYNNIDPRKERRKHHAKIT